MNLHFAQQEFVVVGDILPVGVTDHFLYFVYRPRGSSILAGNIYRRSNDTGYRPTLDKSLIKSLAVNVSCTFCNRRANGEDLGYPSDLTHCLVEVLCLRVV